MKRIDIRVYVDDEAVEVGQGDINNIAKSLTALVVDGANKLCRPDSCPEGFITVVYHIDHDTDLNDLYL